MHLLKRRSPFQEVRILNPVFFTFLMKKWLDQLGHGDRNAEIKQGGNST